MLCCKYSNFSRYTEIKNQDLKKSESYRLKPNRNTFLSIEKLIVLEL